MRTVHLPLWFIAGLGAALLAGYLVGLQATSLLMAITFTGVSALFPLRLPRTGQTAPSRAVRIDDAAAFVTLAALGPAYGFICAVFGSTLWQVRRGARADALRSVASDLACIALAFGVHESLRYVSSSRTFEAQFIALLAATAAYALLRRALWKRLTRESLVVDRDATITSYHLCHVKSLATATLAALLSTTLASAGVTPVAVTVVSLALIAFVMSTDAQSPVPASHTNAVLPDEVAGGANDQGAKMGVALMRAPVPTVFTRVTGGIIQANAAFERLVGASAKLRTKRSIGEFIYAEDVPKFSAGHQALVSANSSQMAVELRLLGSDGRPIWTLMSGALVEGAARETMVVLQLIDMTERRRAESALRYVAYHDDLTGLANRASFRQQLERAIKAHAQDRSVGYAVLFLDLDRFKTVNDSLGHLAGNYLLQEVGGRLKESVAPADVVARLGGDEFAILLASATSTDQSERVAKSIATRIAEPLLINGTEVVVRTSIGVTSSDAGERSVEEVLRDADLAMYAAKAAGNGVATFVDSLYERAVEKLMLETDLRRAIDSGQLHLVFQPLYHLDTGEMLAVEALVRWKHPQLGPISPAKIVKLAEDSGYIDRLTDWVIATSVRQLAHWRASCPSARMLKLHVNISSPDLSRASLADQTLKSLADAGLQPDCLFLEITETTLMSGLTKVLTVMSRLRDAGVRFSIDDFGTGYSSLAYLSTLPIDNLKIDRSFVVNMETAPQNAEIVRAITSLAATLGRGVVAEGIETSAQLDMLRDLGIDTGQGYLLSRPVAPEAIEQLLADQAGGERLELLEHST